jgi:glycosyltransferase involved in cell wall biosynthesis
MLEAVWKVRRPPASLVVPNGYDEDLFRPFSASEVAAARCLIETRHQISLRGRRLIAYTGKIGDWYSGLANLIEALDPQRDLLLLVGDGPLLEKLPQHPGVVRCGVVPLTDVPLYTNAADVLAFPLGVDCSPIVLSEYLAVGKPIVAPRGRIEWLLRDGVFGAIVDDTPAGWREGIERAAGMTVVAAEANRRLARALGWGKLAARFERFLLQVAQRRPDCEAAR